MRHLPHIVVIASLLAGLPVQAAEWPPGVRDTFHKSCVESAGQPLGQERAQRYCQCTVARIDRDFSASEVAALEQAELPEPLIKRLQQVSQQCLEAFGGQG